MFNQLKNLVKTFRHRVVLKVFKRYYGHLVYSFEKADEEISRLSETSKILYYEDVTNWIKSKAYEIEGQGLVRGLYAELATEAKDEDVITAYRLALLKHKNQDIRLRNKAEEYKQLQIVRKRSHSFKV